MKPGRVELEAELMMATISKKLLLLCLTLIMTTLALPAAAADCAGEACDLWKRWRELRYSLYPVIEAQTPHFEARDFDRFWRGPEFSEPLGGFHRRYASEILSWRSSLLASYQAGRPALKAYQALEIEALTRRWHGLGYESYLGQQFLHPFESVEFLQNLLLSRLLQPDELGLFFVRRTQGQTRYSAEPLGKQSWRLWADSYYFVLALDFDLAQNTVAVHGLWGRSQPQQGKGV